MSKKLPVTVLSGFLGAGKTTLLNYILNTQTEMRIAVIVNDMSEVNIDARLVRSQEKLVEMSNGCICCTLREDLLIEISKLAQEGRFEYLLIESTGISEPLPVAETFTFQDENGTSLSDIASLDTLVTVIDAFNFLKDYNESIDLKDKGLALNDDDDRSIVDLLIDQVEFANVIIINKSDLVDRTDLQKLKHIIHRFNPDAELLESSFGQIPLQKIINTGLFDFEKAAQAPGWLKELRGEHIPETQEYNISSFVYKSFKPFHPERFRAYLNEEWPGVLRSKGFFWLSTRMDYAMIWSQAGGACRIELGPSWWVVIPNEEWPEEADLRKEILDNWSKPWGDRRQEIVFIGIDMDQNFLCQKLDACLLTEGELDCPELSWMNFPDPFPEYQLSELTDDVPEETPQELRLA